jgi:hypothetical protein
MHKESFELTLDYIPETGSADRVFLAMAGYISAFEEITFTIGRALDAQAEFGYQLSCVETGSIKSVQNCIAKVEKIAKTLASIPSMLANSMVDIDEISSKEDIDIVAKKIEEQLKSANCTEFPNQVNIDRQALARGLKRLTEAANQLVDGETVKLKSVNSKIVTLNTKTRFPSTPEDIFSEFKETIKKKETLLVKKPVFIGKSAWDFKSIERGKSFSAPILHDEWLNRYQSRELGHLDPGDALIALVSYEATKQKGESQVNFSNHKIMHIERMVKSKEIQSHITYDDLENE